MALRHPAIRIGLLATALLISDSSGASAQTVPKPGTISGCVEIAGHSAYRGVAALWPGGSGKGPDPRRAIRPPIVSGPIGADGCFTLQAEPGEYFIGAIVRLTDGGWQGPPRPGDMVFLSPDASDQNTVVTIRPAETVAIGRHATGWEYSGFNPAASPLTISGKLATREGKPLPGLLVFAFTDSTLSKEPLAISEPSDSNGRYLLRLPEPATVYLRAREHYGQRSPLDGGYMGIYGGGTPLAVNVDADADKQECNLTLIHIPPADLRQKEVTELNPGQKQN